MRSRARPLSWRLALVVAVAAGFAAPGRVAIAAQEPSAAPPPRDTTRNTHRAPLFTQKDAYIAGGFVLATIIAFPIDREAALELQDPGTQANRFFKHASTGVELIASPGAYLIGGSLYGIGRVARLERLADLGWHGTEAVLIGDAVTNILKGLLGRSRPFVTNDSNPTDFRFGAGFGNGDRKSFPSGHTTTAFAAASAVTGEVMRWWPRSTWIIAPAMYGGATLVGLSRMYHNKHWASDVALGAAIGTFAGRKVVDYSHQHPGNMFDRVMLGTRLVPTAGGGAKIMVTVPW